MAAGTDVSSQSISQQKAYPARLYVQAAGDVFGKAANSAVLTKILKVVTQWLQMIQQYCTHLSHKTLALISKFKDGFGAALSFGIFSKWISTFTRMYSSSDDYVRAKDKKAEDKAVSSATFDSIELLGDTAKVLMLFNPIFLAYKLISDISDFLVDLNGARDADEKIQEASKKINDITKSEKISEADAKELIKQKETKSFNKLLLVKSIASVAATCIGMVAFFYGNFMLSAVIALSVTTVSVIFKIYAEWKKEAMTHKMEERFQRLEA